MTSQWVSFIHDLDPNNSGGVPPFGPLTLTKNSDQTLNSVTDAPTWTNYADEETNMVFNRQGSFIESDDFRKEGIAFINQLGAQLKH